MTTLSDLARRARAGTLESSEENGMLGVRPVVNASLAADHRVSDGHCGARFLAAVRRHLEAPQEL